MPCVCRLFRLAPECVILLVEKQANLAQTVEAAAIYSGVYRYWHAIQYLLSSYQPASANVNWLTAGEIVFASSDEIPAARVIFANEVNQINVALQKIEPDDLIPYYDAEALDGAGVYPQCWRAWEETFDPLGQVLEHYWFLKQFVRQCATAGDALLLYFEFDDDGSDEFDDDSNS